MHPAAETACELLHAWRDDAGVGKNQFCLARLNLQLLGLVHFCRYPFPGPLCQFIVSFPGTLQCPQGIGNSLS
jgi:hypothetical protein